MASKPTNNPKNQQSNLFKSLTRLFSGPIINYRSQSGRRIRRQHLDKFSSRFKSASGQQFKKSLYNPLDQVSTNAIQNQRRAERYVDFDQMEYIGKDRLPDVIGSHAYHCAVMDTASKHLHPLKFVHGLAEAAVKAGVVICEQSPVTSYTGTPVVVKTDQGQVTAAELVLACNAYIEKLEPKINGYIMPINNFVLATEPLSDELAREIIPLDTSMADSRFVINYWKLSADNRLLFGGGENYRRGFPSDIKGFVQQYMLQVYPQLADSKIDYGWGGRVAITMNRLPHFGRLQDNIWYMQGYSGHGVPTATFAGKLIAEAVSGKLERFDLMADLPTAKFPGGTLLRWPGMVAGMLYYALRDRF